LHTLFSALLPPGVGEGAKAQKTKEKKDGKENRKGRIHNRGKQG
jgi:hypothetical protein